jgi:aarF domain-containing kinase
MRINPRALFGGPVPWTCSQCSTKTRPNTAKRAFGSAREVKIIRNRKPVKRVYLAAASAAGAGVGALVFSDNIKHGYEAAERSGRVLGCLAVNINECAFLVFFKKQN